MLQKLVILNVSSMRMNMAVHGLKTRVHVLQKLVNCSA